MTSPNQFFRNESENLASQKNICKFIPLIQCEVSIRDQLHSAMFAVAMLHISQKHCINKYEVIINYKNTVCAQSVGPPQRHSTQKSK